MDISHIDNCTVFADVTGTTSVGGLVGASEKGYQNNDGYTEYY